MIEREAVPLSRVEWRGAVRIIRSIHPPIDLFEDIADPSDWPLLLSAEQKTNPRLMETIGNLDLIPPERRVGGPGASWLMAPFTHCSTERPTRFSDGSYGVLYAGIRFEVALSEIIHHHGRFMRSTAQPEGWTSQFREILLDIRARLRDLRPHGTRDAAILDRDDYRAAQGFGARMRAAGDAGVVYPSVRCDDGDCAGLFYPDLATNPVQGRHIDLHWDGARVDLYRDASGGRVYRIL